MFEWLHVVPTLSLTQQCKKGCNIWKFSILMYLMFILKDRGEDFGGIGMAQ
jgi:hypothetical protein